jgi:hypothetical protein
MRRCLSAMAVLLVVAVCSGLAAESAPPLTPENLKEVAIKYNLIAAGLSAATRELVGVKSTATEKELVGVEACVKALTQLRAKLEADGQREFAMVKKALEDQEKAKKAEEEKAKKKAEPKAKADASLGPPEAPVPIAEK